MFFSGDKRKTRKNMGPLLKETGDLVTQDIEKAEVMNAFFTSVITSKTSLQESEIPEMKGKGWSKEGLSLVEEDQVKEYVRKLDMHVHGPVGMHSPVLRELPDITAKPLLILLDESWQLREVPEDWRKANVIPIFKKKDPENYRPFSLTSIPAKVVEQLILETISRRTNNKKIVRSHQHGFTKQKPCLINLINFYGEMTGLVDGERAMDIVYMDFNKALDSVSRKFLIDKLMYRLDELTVRWIEN